MKKILLIFSLFFLIVNPVSSMDFQSFFADYKADNQVKSVKRFFKKQVNYANRMNLKKYLSLYDDSYVSADGFNKKIYTSMINDIWDSYNDIEYDIDIKKITVDNDKAVVELVETSYAELSMTDVYKGELKSESDTIYYLKKDSKNNWRIVKDDILVETTTMLYGTAKGLDVKLMVPDEILPNTDYIASLEFEPPADTIAIASIASDIVEYPQKPTKEIFRALPDDNILERFFTSNDGKANEYVIASIGLTKTAIEDLSLKLSLTGFGYAIKRVNLINEEKQGELNDKDK